jgi:putative ABC transport system permease protein
MFSSYLAAAWRSFLRDRLYALINIIGLAIGLSAAVLSGMYLHNELTFEQFLPGYEHIYRISAEFAGPGKPMTPVDPAPSGLAPWLKVRMPSLQPVARLSGGSDVAVRVGQVDTLEHIRWADPAFFDIFHFPVEQGDLLTSLQRPDAIVLTRSAARRLFGRDRVVGETVLVDHVHIMRVAAVLQDLPSNTHFEFSVIGSALAEFSSVATADREPGGAPGVWDANTYFRLGPAVTLAGVRTAVDAYIREKFDPPGKQNQIRRFLPVMPIAAIHLAPEGAAAMRAHVSLDMLYAIGGVGLLILAVSIINFVNLSTARAARRKIEVAIRKAVGATQGQLMVQFIGEAGLYAALAAILAACMVELVLPGLNHLAGTEFTFDYRGRPVMLVWAAGLTLLVGLLAGAYPALVLGSIKPVAALKGGPVRAGGVARSVLVTTQFAILIGLLCTIIVVSEQTSLAREAVERLNVHGVSLIVTDCGQFPLDRVRALPGVAMAGCSDSAPQGLTKRHTNATLRDGTKVMVRKEMVGDGFFEVYGLKPLAGRVFLPDHAADSQTIILNATAVKRFGFRSASAALGEFVGSGEDGRPAEVVGVIPDFPLESVRMPIEPTLFAAGGESHLLSVRALPGQERTVQDGLQTLWKQVQPFRPIVMFPVDQALRDFYADLIAAATVFGICSAVALLLACTGLFGLTSFAVERRTRETGIRKAMGAGRGDILRLMFGQLTLPVLEANVVAWPVCFFLLRHWLSGFAYHVDLGAEVFFGAGLVAVLVAWATICVQVFRLAALHPVASLRYE